MSIWIHEFLHATGFGRTGRLRDTTRLVQRVLDLVAPPDVPSGPAAPAVAQPPARPAAFTAHSFDFAGESHAYRLFVPSGTGEPGLLPLLVLLHGCKQDAADFAQGTAMNVLAEQEKCIVLYPEQRVRANSLRCWNWFDKAHQGRDAGEPAMLAALTREVLALCPADPARVYVAGLSAGGAMALLVAGLYPELFAAAGVHSGVPTGAASDVMSAFSAMRKGAQRLSGAAGDTAVPTIVFHGSADRTVHPENALHIVEDALAELRASGLPLEGVQHTEAAGRPTERTVYSLPGGLPQVELWTVDAGPHAWSGGDAGGSFTDPQGPSASRAMLEFFLQHRQSGAMQKPA